MSYDTSRDPRLLVAQRACALLRRSLQVKTPARTAISKDRVGELLTRSESAVMSLLYLYQEPAALAVSPAMAELVSCADAIADAVAPVIDADTTPGLLAANLQWCLRTLRGVAERIVNGGTSLASGVDLTAVQVRNVTARGGLWLTRVNDGAADYTVVTNMAGVKAGDVLAVAFLPPREVGGAVSEAMFLGGERRGETAGDRLGEHTVDACEAIGLLHDEIGRR